jgi:S1-C subfamily serine protease
VQVHGGNSGGPLLDKDGQVVGICAWGYSADASKTGQNLNFFIPIDEAVSRLRIGFK